MGLWDNIKKRIKGETIIEEIEDRNQMHSRSDHNLYEEAENELIETEEQQKGLFARLKERYNKWREQQELKREEAIKTKAREALVKAQQEAEKRSEMDGSAFNDALDALSNETVLETLGEIGETDEIENHVVIGELNQPEATSDFFSTKPIEPQGRKGLWGWLKDAVNEAEREVLIEDLDREIRQESRSVNYLNLSNDSYEDAELFFREEAAMAKVFERNQKALEKCFSQEEIADLYLKFQERAQLYDEVRREGLEVRVGKIARLKTLETYFGVKSAESIRYLESLEIEIKAKQKVRGLDRRIADEYRLEINDGRGRGDSDQARKPLAEYLNGAKARRDARTAKKVEKWKERQTQPKGQERS